MRVQLFHVEGTHPINDDSGHDVLVTQLTTEVNDWLDIHPGEYGRLKLDHCRFTLHESVNQSGSNEHVNIIGILEYDDK